MDYTEYFQSSTREITNKLSDPNSRNDKAHKIAAILADAYKQNLSEATLLDIGCSYGLITRHLASLCHTCIGLEYERAALPLKSDFPLFIQGNAEQMPIQSASVDIVICAQVYEHTTHANLLISEIHRVLRPEGICFFSGPNRLFPYEYHYRLPFIHWLSDKAIERILPILRPQLAHNVHSKTIWGLRRLVGCFCITDYTYKILKDPSSFSCADEMGSFGWLHILPTSILKRLIMLSPNFNWVLCKNSSDLEDCNAHSN